MSKTFDHIDYLTHMVNKLDKENKELKERVAELEKYKDGTSENTDD